MGTLIHSGLCGRSATICRNGANDDINNRMIQTCELALPAIAIELIGLFLYYHETSELMVCNFPVRDCSEVGSLKYFLIRVRWPGIFDVQHHEYLRYLIKPR